MNGVPGTQGYERAVDRFIEVSQSLAFADICGVYADYLPSVSGRVLDVGAGAGQNAAALARMGYAVVAVEPMGPFLAAARAKYSTLPITWFDGSLPLLECLDTAAPFDFAIVEGVWHHLTPSERSQAMVRLEALLKPSGRFAMSLRNGPPGMGSRVFSTSVPATIADAHNLGLACVFREENLPSVLPNKGSVRWSRIVLAKTPLAE